MFRDRLTRALWAAAGIGILARLALPWVGWSFLIERLVSDDAFYYLTIARNVVGGAGATFDGATPTNGFHPLWLVCLLPIYAVAGDHAELALRLSLALGALLSAATVALLGATVKAWTRDSLTGALAAALLALNPYAIMEGVNGLETALALLMLTVVLALLARDPAGWRGVLVLGLASGALVLARSDMALVLAGLYAYLLCSRRMRFWPLAGAGGVAGFMVALWLAWSWATVGALVQSSAVAIPWLVRARMEDAVASGWMTPAQIAGRVWRHFWQTSLYQWLNYAGVGLLAGLIGLAARVASRARARIPAGRQPGWVWWGGAGTLAMLLASEFIRFSLREWYIAPLALWSAVLGAGLLAPWAALPKTRRLLVIVCAALALVAGGQAGRDLSTRGRYWFQSDQYAAARWIAAHTPPDAIVGSWTAGIYGYFAERRVVNLDGVVNWDAIRAYRARRLYAYMREQRIGWVVDFDEFVSDFTHFFGADVDEFLAPVETFEDAHAPFGRLVIYEVAP